MKQWTPERIAELSAQDIRQLRENAERLNESELAALCGEALKSASRMSSPPRQASLPRTQARRLVARTRAFEARGVWLHDPRTSWSGVRKSDGAIVMALWADDIASAAGTCSYLLWRPNVGGARPWSDSSPGRERLDHCRRAMTLGAAEGLLVYGRALTGRLPEEKVCSVYGADPETVIRFAVQPRGEEYWAVWGRAAPPKG